MKAILASFLVLFALTAAANAEPAMWEVRDGDSAIRLFGSVHALPSNIDWRTPALADAIAASEQVYFETDIGPRGFIALTVKMAVASFQAAGTPWLQLLSGEQLEHLKTAIEPLGISIDDAGRMAPWMLSLQLAGQQLSGNETSAEYAFTSGVEWTLQLELLPDRKAFLETPGEQFDLLAAGTLNEQIASLFAMMGETDGGDALGEIVRAWATGDVDALAQTVVPKSDADKAGIDKLLFNRNRNWIPQLEALLAENREDLIVVGAAHLAGEGSVLDLLQAAGYTVTRVQ